MKIEIKNADDKWQEIDGIKENHQRLVKIKIGKPQKQLFYFNINQRKRNRRYLFNRFEIIYGTKGADNN